MVSKSRCPECAKIGRDKHGDNLITYDDGGVHCFSCGLHSSGDNKHPSRRPVLGPRDNDQPQDDITLLPWDVDTAIPTKALNWLKQYYLTFQDIIDNGVCWSESRQLLVFPYDNCWQGRYFGTDPTHPKWWSKGNLDDLLWGKRLTHPIAGGIVLCEDIISTIRVGKVSPSLCLFGSNLSKTRLGRLLSHVSENIIFWLDYDKKDYAQKQALYIQGFGFQSSCIITPKDPKEYSPTELISILLQK